MNVIDGHRLQKGDILLWGRDKFEVVFESRLPIQRGRPAKALVSLAPSGCRVQANLSDLEHPNALDRLARRI